MGKVVNKRELSDTFDISERTLTEYQKAGMPMVFNAGRGASNEYDTAQVHTWLLDRALSKVMSETPKDRLDRVKADKIELEIARELGQVAPAAEFERAWSDHIQAARIELLTMPDILASEITALYGISIDPDIIRVRVEGALDKLTSFDADEYDDPEQSDPAAFDAADGEEDD